MLDVLFQSNGLQSWQIFEEKSGSIVAKLRFAANSHGSVDSITPVSFKKKSASQVQRDFERSKAHKKDKGTVTNKLQCTTRSQSRKTETEIEQPRHDDLDLYDTGMQLSPAHCINSDHSTPMSPINNCDLISNTSVTCSHASVDSINNISMLTEPAMSAGVVHSLPVTVVPADVGVIQKPDELDDSVETLYEDYPKCANILCDYEMGGQPDRHKDYSVPLYVCVKCSRPNGASCTICANCLQTGAHARHKEHLIDYKTSKWFHKENPNIAL